MPLEKQNTVKFDPSKKAHRASAAAFMRRRSWSDAPIRFSHDPAFGCVADQIEKKLLTYYMSKDKLTIPPPLFQAVMVGTIIDGALTEQKGPVVVKVFKISNPEAEWSGVPQVDLENPMRGTGPVLVTAGAK
jgi:hypothetical protein